MLLVQALTELYLEIRVQNAEHFTTNLYIEILVYASSLCTASDHTWPGTQQANVTWPSST